MTKFTAFTVLVALRIIFHPSDTRSDRTPFASTSPPFSSTLFIAPAKLIHITGSISDHKVILNWVVAENESADKFEVEKSTDGKIFTMAALVFGTDRSETDNYQFYEKAGNKKILYRVKMINKNQEAEYSSVIELNPNI
ncbi:MAG TPA: hypothetical protein VK483_08710 [Chitinophagaceae bacterium]|nr:hypothetical protein [Chitinophagaceae bacterium]